MIAVRITRREDSAVTREKDYRKDFLYQVRVHVIGNCTKKLLEKSWRLLTCPVYKAVTYKDEATMHTTTIFKLLAIYFAFLIWLVRASMLITSSPDVCWALSSTSTV
jgi:hypothetical protein